MVFLEIYCMYIFIFQLILWFKFQAGGGEDLFSTDKSKEQLYIEAKHVLNLVEPYTTTTKRPHQEPLNGVSPPQTVPRKPPRSKHDPCSNGVIRPPSQEAAQRVLIVLILVLVFILCIYLFFYLFISHFRYLLELIWLVDKDLLSKLWTKMEYLLNKLWIKMEFNPITQALR